MYLREALVLLVLARVAVHVLPTATLVAWASRQPRRPSRFAASGHVEWVSWAIDRVASKPWLNANCLPRALAAQTMLRRRGVASRLCLGVAREGDGLIAHAWIEHAADVVTGAREAPHFKRLVEFGR